MRAARAFALLVILIVVGAPVAARGAPAVVSLLTMSPGEHPFERFGHTALRVDHGDGADPVVYNYGTFDGADPQLVRKFLRHELPYWLSVTRWSAIQDSYARRRITIQELALTPAEVDAIVARLDENARPERREYRYEFFRDNCSTRVRDMIAASVPSLRTAAEARPGVTTYRGAVRSVLAPVPFYRRAIDLVLNERTDEPVTRWDDAFLPRELESLLRESRRADGQRLVARESTWTGPAYHEPPGGRPWIELLWLVLLLPFAYVAAVGERDASSRVTCGIGVALWGLVTGLAGCALLTLSLTPYDVARANGSIVALWPATLLLVPFGAALAFGRLGAVGVQRLRALLVALLGPIVVDLAGHAVGLATQHHVELLLYVAAGHILALLALRSMPVREVAPLRNDADATTTWN